MNYGKDVLSEKSNNKDDLLFRPITEGLGFHQEDREREHIEKMFRPDVKRAQTNHKQAPRSIVKPLPALPLQNPQMLLSSAQPKAEIALGPPQAQKAANFGYEVAAFVADVILIFVGTSLLLGLLLFVALWMGDISLTSSENRPMVKQFIVGMMSVKIIFNLLLLYLVNYFLYLIFIDLTEKGTPGKTILGLKLEGKVGAKAIFLKTLLGPLDYRGKFSGLRVVVKA